MGRFLIHIDAQDAQDFFRRRLDCVPGHPQIRTRSSPESASPAAASRPDYPVHPVHRCSIYSPSRWICPVAGGGRPARGQSGVSQRGQAGFQRSRPPDTPHLTIGTTPPGSAGVPPALPGGLPPMTGSHQRDKRAEAFWRQLSLKEVHQSSCLFVSICGSSSKTISSFFLE